MSMAGNISFKSLYESDFPLIHKWLNIDFVTKWYEKRKFTYDDVERKYGNYLKPEVPTQSFIIEYDTKPIGYVQTYRIYDYPAYAACIEMDEKTAGMDLFIGEKDFIGKGLGRDIVQKFLKDIVFRKETIDKVIVGLEPDNKAAIRVYEKAGFKYLKTVQIEGEKEPEYIMVIRKRPEDHLLFSRET